MLGKNREQNKGGDGEDLLLGVFVRRREGVVGVCPAVFSHHLTLRNQLSVESTYSLCDRCIFVHMPSRDTPFSCVIMKFIYHYTWSRQIIFNSQKLVKRRWTVKKAKFCTPCKWNQISKHYFLVILLLFFRYIITIVAQYFYLFRYIYFT